MDIDKLAPALVALQADLKPVGKSAVNPFFKSKYADLPAVMECIQPLLAKHKLAVSQFVTNIEGQSALRTILIHESGQTIEDTAPLLLSKQDPQGQGSAITYARRYGVMAVLGVVADEDDDGNKASGHGKEPNSTNQSFTASPNKPVSDSQRDLIRKLALEANMPEEGIEVRLAQIKTSAEASEAIKKLKGEV